MDTLQIVAISSKSEFPKLIRESLQSYPQQPQSLPPLQIDHLSSLEEEIPETMTLSALVVLVDFESLSGDLEDGVKMVQENFPGRVLVLISEGASPEKFPSFQIDNPIYIINRVNSVNLYSHFSKNALFCPF